MTTRYARIAIILLAAATVVGGLTANVAHADSIVCVSGGWPNTITACQSYPDQTSRPAPPPAPAPTPPPPNCHVRTVSQFSTKNGLQTVSTMLPQLKALGYTGSENERDVVPAYAQATGAPVTKVGTVPNPDGSSLCT
jgi:hypothetical protein